ncbi:MAG: hypothetical protein LBU76_08015 [Azoarcus sp.]|jgi:hypothetical protein|nr:hypothetical protein [Azoarcus sp.]
MIRAIMLSIAVVLLALFSVFADAEIICDDLNRCRAYREPDVRHVRTSRPRHNEREMTVTMKNGEQYKIRERTDRPGSRHYFREDRYRRQIGR